jgi:hypothetical protein
MATDLNVLIAGETEDAAFSDYLTRLAGQGFPATTWHSGAVVYTILRFSRASPRTRSR